MPLASRDGTHDKEGLGTRRDRVGQRRIRRLMGHILFAGEEPYERPALQRDMIADRPAEHRKPVLECVENRAQRNRTVNLKLYLIRDARQRSQMMRKPDAYHHGSV